MTDRRITKMKRMEDVLTYMISHIHEELPMQDTAKRFGYNPDYFSRAFNAYFGYRYTAFFNMLKMRQAAREIVSRRYPKGLNRDFGFKTTQSFSKAFKSVIGVSPRTFYKENYSVPDMPLKGDVEGVKFTLSYRENTAFRMKGTVIGAPERRKIVPEHSAAYALDHDISASKAEPGSGAGAESGADGFARGLDTGKESYIGIWWSDNRGIAHYVLGRKSEVLESRGFPPESVPDDAFVKLSEGAENVDLDIEGGYYAVFTMKRGDNDMDTARDFRVLARFIFNEWLMMNDRRIDKMLSVYEIYTRDSVSICIPVPYSSESVDKAEPHEWGVAGWIRKIDDRITEPITARMLAKEAYYSEKNFNEIFSSYYGMTPHEYIWKKRLYLAASELGQGLYRVLLNTEYDDDRELVAGLAAKYHYHSAGELDEALRAEFDWDSTVLESLPEFYMPDLNDYYEKYKGELRVRFTYMDELRFLPTSHPDVLDLPSYDVTRAAAYWFTHDTADMARSKPRTRNMRKVNKLFIWADEPVNENGEDVYDFLLGTVVDPDDQQSHPAIPASGSRGSEVSGNDGLDKSSGTGSAETVPKYMEIPGGRYACFRTENQEDVSHLNEVCRKMMRLAFGGWIHENFYRVDFSRRSFIQFKNNKVKFCVPILQ